MGAVAKGRCVRVLTAAKPYFFRLFQHKLDGRKTCPLVAAIAEGLILAAPARTPPIRPRLEFFPQRGFLSNHRLHTP